MSQLSESELKELQNPNNWEDGGEIEAPRRKRSIVSVALASSELAALSRAAKSNGTPISTYMREAALSRAAVDVFFTLAVADEATGRHLLPQTPTTLTHADLRSATVEEGMVDFRGVWVSA